MKRLVCFSTHPIKRLVPPIILALLVLLLAGTIALAAPPGVHKYYFASVIDTSFTVSWTSDTAGTASINYGTTPALGSTINDAQNNTTHYISVQPLSGGTTYYFDIVTNGVVDDNGGLHFTITTGPMLGTPGNRTSYGFIYQSGGTPAQYAIAYIKVTHLGVDSQLVAVRTNASGLWSYNLGNLRTADFTAYFPWAVGDTITVIGQGGVLGTGQVVSTIPSGTTAFSAGDITLNNVPNAITLRSLSSHAEASAWLPIGLALLGAAAIVVVVARKRRG
jgi:hypothetical protein